MTPWEKKIYLRIIQKKEIEVEDLSELICFYNVDEIEHGHSRWTAHMETIIEFHGKHYSIDWERGLTEYQEDEIYPQILQEVEKVKVVREVEEWVVKKNS